MSDVAVNNTTAGLSGKSLLASDVDATVTALHTFNRGAGSAPFGINSGAAVVPNLDADKLDGLDASSFARIGTASTWTAAQQFPAGTVAAPGVGIGDSDVGIYSSGTNALDFATNGAKALGIDSTQFVDSPTQPRAVAYHNTTQSINDATNTALSLNSDDVDIGSAHDTVTNNSRLTVPAGADGFYAVVGTASFAANATGVRDLRIRKNGTTMLTSVRQTDLAASQTTFQVVTLVQLAAADYLELIGFQNSGGALNTGDASSRDLQNALMWVKLW